VKKKDFLTDRDKKDWEVYSKNLEGIYDKDLSSTQESYQKKKIKKLDLHGMTLLEANKKVEKFITKSYEEGIEKIIIITGKGSRSKVHEDPYRSEKMSVLRYSVPEYIKNNENLNHVVKEISEAHIKDGGQGAIYIFLKKNLQNKF